MFAELQRGWWGVTRGPYPRAAALRLSALPPGGTVRCRYAVQCVAVLRAQWRGHTASRRAGDVNPPVTVGARGASVAAGANRGRTVNPGEGVSEVRKVRSEKSEVRSSNAVFGGGSRVGDAP